MKVVRLKEHERDTFLAGKRLATLSTNSESGYPVSVPVWYGWDGTAVRMFSMRTGGKIARLRRDPRANVLVANTFGEHVRWVAFDGRITIGDSTGLEAAEALLPRYVEDVDSEAGRLASALFRSVAPLLVELRLVPERIRTYAEVHS